MYRCLLAAFAAFAFALPAAAQVQRAFPQNALRGVAVFGNPPELTINGKAALLAPGARIRGFNNMLEMSSTLIGLKATVNYTVDLSGLVKDIWVLRKEEIAMSPWPTTVEQLQSWSFDPVNQTWTKP
jgi:hypothetical protein